MRFEIDTKKKLVIIKEKVNIVDLLNWMKASIGTQGWEIRHDIR